MQIEDVGIVLATKKMQEKSFLIKCFTKKHGILSGYYRLPKMCTTGIMFVGKLVWVTWHARVQEHLGTYTQIDSMEAGLCYVFHTNTASSLIWNSTLSMYMQALKEQDPCQTLWHKLEYFLSYLQVTENLLLCARKYLLLELSLLKYCGFGLDTCCYDVSTTNNIYTSRNICATISSDESDACNMSQSVKNECEKYVLYMKKLRKLRAHNISYTEIVESFEIVELFINQHLVNPTPMTRNLLYNFFKQAID